MVVRAEEAQVWSAQVGQTRLGTALNLLQENLHIEYFCHHGTRHLVRMILHTTTLAYQSLHSHPLEHIINLKIVTNFRKYCPCQQVQTHPLLQIPDIRVPQFIQALQLYSCPHQVSNWSVHHAASNIKSWLLILSQMLQTKSSLFQKATSQQKLFFGSSASTLLAQSFPKLKSLLNPKIFLVDLTRLICQYTATCQIQMKFCKKNWV